MSLDTLVYIIAPDEGILQRFHINRLTTIVACEPSHGKLTHQKCPLRRLFCTPEPLLFLADLAIMAIPSYLWEGLTLLIGLAQPNVPRPLPGPNVVYFGIFTFEWTMDLAEVALTVWVT